MSAQTLVEKILARCAGQPVVRAGDEIVATPDFVHAYELKGTTDVIRRDMATLGTARISAPSKFAIYIDHRVPAKTPDQEAFHEETRGWALEQGMALYDRVGIGHQVAAEQGYAIPGSFSVHADGHIAQLGAFGALAIGLRGNIIEAFARDRVSMVVPHSIKIVLTGNLSVGVMGRDVFHHLLFKYGAEFAAFQALEFSGPGADALSAESRQTICGLAMFTGAITALFDPSDRVLATVTDTSRASIPFVRADEDAVYSRHIQVVLDEVEPMIVLPPSPANASLLAAHLGIPLNAGYLGSCASGRVEDLQIAAQILSGKTIKSGFSLHVVPTSQKILSEAASNGSLAALVSAGAFVSSPSCDFCSGNIATMAAGQRAVSTGTLNVPGRMGHVDSSIYLTSAATVAASALHGSTTDPRPYLS
ncbi:aconitase family protein [Paraburkholderia sp. BCC1884]|uniref:aconitase family protein n=1 Tax=Paraburkholderia sp. BCC1884 TaxID=2562668 RepID=UPI001183A79A|nr:aconitase family protein [Paraburkholderia sp. BCC1884]